MNPEKWENLKQAFNDAFKDFLAKPKTQEKLGEDGSLWGLWSVAYDDPKAAKKSIRIKLHRGEEKIEFSFPTQELDSAEMVRLKRYVHLEVSKKGFEGYDNNHGVSVPRHTSEALMAGKEDAYAFVLDHFSSRWPKKKTELDDPEDVLQQAIMKAWEGKKEWRSQYVYKELAGSVARQKGESNPTISWEKIPAPEERDHSVSAELAEQLRDTVEQIKTVSGFEPLEEKVITAILADPEVSLRTLSEQFSISEGSPISKTSIANYRNRALSKITEVASQLGYQELADMGAALAEGKTARSPKKPSAKPIEL